MKSLLPIGLGIVIVIVGVGYLVAKDTDAQQESVLRTSGETARQDELRSPTIEDGSDVGNTPAGLYAPYRAEAIATSNADRILLFFHATWCPSCKALDADIVKNTGAIPDGVAIYKVDYDTSTELKRRYGVTTQHSIIEINKNGEALSTISHPLTLAAVIATLK